jgi:uncharacterized protein with HEPN domain
MSPRDEVSLRQMLDHSLEALQLAAGRSRSDLDSDRLFNLAMTRLLEIIGEATGRVSQSVQDSQPQIAWSQIVGLRNRLIHGYDEVDFDILWRIVENDLPALVVDLQTILSNP